MLLGSNDRYAIECEMELIRAPKDAPSMPLSECITGIKNLFVKGEAIYPVNSGKSVVKLIGLDIKLTHVVLLFLYANADALDQHFANIKTGKTRKADRGENEAPALTSHMVVSLNPKDAERFPDLYKVIVEEVPGINRQLLSNAMTSLISKATEFSFSRKNKKKKDSIIKCRPIINISPYASRTLGESFTDSYLWGLTATRYYSNTPLGEDCDLDIAYEALVITPPRTMGKKAVEYIKQASDKVRGMNYSDLKITRKDKNKRLVSDEIAISKEKSLEEIADSVFAQKEKIILSQEIIPCQEKIHKELIEKMEKILLK